MPQGNAGIQCRHPVIIRWPAPIHEFVVDSFMCNIKSELYENMSISTTTVLYAWCQHINYHYTVCMMSAYQLCIWLYAWYEHINYALYCMHDSEIKAHLIITCTRLICGKFLFILSFMSLDVKLVTISILRLVYSDSAFNTFIYVVTIYFIKIYF